jgi:L-ascorbate metabolism protein UlaG (beta-lactamase superfamily)
MRITFIGHASLLIEANGLRMLSDPWWNGPCFGAQWWPYPLPYVEALKDQRIDYVYISHGHHDHLHPPTLKLFRSAKVLVAAGSELPVAIRDLGLDVIECAAGGEIELGNGVRCRIMETYADDTMLAVSAGGETCVNLNDSLHAAPETVQQKFFRLIRQLYGRPDYVFCGYGTASHFPNCYVIPGKDPAATAGMRQAYFNRAWATIMHEIRPRFGFPFAADVAFLDDDLFWCNEPVHNAQRPTEVFEKLFGRSTGTRVMDIAPGFAIDGGAVVREQIRQPLVAEDVRRVYSDAIKRVNKIADVEVRTVGELRDMLEKNIAKGTAYFADYERDYRCLVDIKGASAGIRVRKTGRKLRVEVTDGAGDHEESYDVIYRTRASYLRQSLASRYGHEVLFVGSGGIFEFPKASTVATGIHRELMAIVKPFEEGGPRRPVGRAGALGMAKRLVKRLLGMSRADLYDLETWTVLAGEAKDQARLG